MSKVDEVLKELTDRIISKLKEAKKDNNTPVFDSPWDGDPMPINFTTGAYYNGINIFNLWLAAEKNEFPSNQWCTPNQLITYAKSNKLEINFKGQKTTPIIKWVEGYKPTNSDPDTPGITFPRVFNVLNKSQIEGIPVEETKEILITREAVNKWVNDIGAEIKHGGDRAFFNNYDDHIGIPEIHRFKSEDHYWNVLFHELTHWTGHKTRLDRLQVAGGTKETYAYEELIAEMGAALTSALMNVPSKVNHAGYIDGYISLLKNDYNILKTAASKAGQAYQYLQSPENRRVVA